ncbi:MAG: efflux RND transporter periplasmic adaptor subunit [Akkermansia sp.]
MKGLLKIIIVLVVLGGVWWGWNLWRSEEEMKIDYRVSPLSKSDLRLTIDSTGTVVPEELVDVGAQVGGIILEFGKDAEGKTVDYSSEVKSGQLLARIDDVLVESDIKKAEAAVAQAEANIVSSRANIIQSKAKHAQMARDRERAERLGAGDALSQSSYEQYISDEEAAKAQVDMSVASLAQAEASLKSAKASLEKEMRNRVYTRIVSPVDGVIVNRLVNIGQTVVSSMSAPSLFLIARDLSHVQVLAAVNEADIGSIYRGQKVVFSVEAFPGRQFEGTVNKIRLNATMTSNVVTYVVEVNALNPKKVLLPYLTADVNFIVEDLKDTFVVPNAALRYTPSLDMIDPTVKDEYLSKLEKRLPSDSIVTSGKSRTRAIVWEQRGNYVVPLDVEAGESNGMVTPIFGSALKVGVPIVLNASRLNEDGVSTSASASSADTNNPFVPKMPARNKNKKRSQDGAPPHP